MRTNIKVLAWLYIVMSALGVLVGAFFLFILFGTGLAIGEREVVGISLAVGMALAVFCTLVSVPGILVGLGLLSFRPWARVLALVLATLNLPWFPFGTVLGIYTYFSLLSSEAAILFEP